MNAHMSDWAIEYLRHVLTEKGWTAADMARAAGVAHSTINRPLTTQDWPHAISRKTLARVAEVSGIDPAPFSRGEMVGPTPHPDDPPRVGQSNLVPVYNVAASAGDGAVIDGEDVVGAMALPDSYLKRLTRANIADLSIIGVKGDSMVPSLHDDDIVMLDRSKRDLSFDGLFVIRDDGAGLLVKRIGRASRRGYIMLISDNRDLYPSVERPLDEIEVIGKVIWCGRKL